MTVRIPGRIIQRLIATCIVLLSFALAESQEIEYVGSYYLGGEFMGLYVNLPYAVCGMNRGFQILDIYNPDEIFRLGDNPFVGHVRRFAVSGDYAYATIFDPESTEFFIIDFQELNAPVITGVLEPVGNGEIAISDDYAYVLNYDEPVDIIDISDPYNPEVVGTYVNNDYNYDIFVTGTYAYLASRDVGLRVLDISNPLEPTVIAQYSSPVSEYAREVIVSGTYAITASYTSAYNTMIEIVDVSDPYNPAYVGHLDVWNPKSLFVRGNYIYAFQEWFYDAAFFIIVNIEDPTNPYLESSTEFGIILSRLIVSAVEDRAYLASNYSLTVMDVSDPSSPAYLGRYTEYPGLRKVVISGNYVFGLMSGDLYAFSVAEPASPQLVGAYEIHSITYDLKVVGNYVYVAYDGFEVIDISTPGSPTFAGRYETAYTKGIDIQNEYAYLAVANQELQIVDITDLDNPTLIGQCPVESPRGITVRGDLAYIARYRDNLGLAIVDVSDPYQPVFLGGCEAPGRVHTWVTVQGQYAYMTVGYYGMQIIDISDPHNPDPVAYYETPGRVDDVYIKDNYAFIADVQNGLIIADISDPGNPEFVASFDTPGLAGGCYSDGEYDYVADNYSLMILEFTPGPCEYIPGDCNHNGIALELGDVAAMIGNYRGTVGPYYICNCGVDPPGSHFAATADPDGNCVPLELGDVVTEIGAYRGTTEPSGCPDCPGSRR